MSIHQSTPAAGSQSVPSPSSARASTTQVISTIVDLLRAVPVPAQPAAEAGEGFAADRDGDEDDGAVDDEQRAAGEVQRRQEPGQDGQHQRAGDGAEIVAAAAEDRGAADRDRRDRGEEIGVAHAEIGLAGIAGQQHAGERGGRAGDHVGQHDGAGGRHAGELGDGRRWCRARRGGGRRRPSTGARVATQRQRQPDQRDDRDRAEAADRQELDQRRAPRASASRRCRPGSGPAG